MKSLRARGAELADAQVQLRVLHDADVVALPAFARTMADHGVPSLVPTRMRVLQLNIGKMCNQSCKHCHVDAGPDRTEMMSRHLLQTCIDVARDNAFDVVDITGGAPEMHPDFRWLVTELTSTGIKVMVRCNLTIIVANPKYHDLPEFYAQHGVHVVSSLPFYEERNTDRQRGDGTFRDSIRALHMLNDVGYGIEGTGHVIDLVYNPVGALLPGPQAALEQDFKRVLRQQHGLEFNSLICITNMPISRFLDFLLSSGNYVAYMEKLVNAFNPAAALGVMCRDTISVGYDGTLYDCDFNQMLDLPVAGPSRHITQFDASALMRRHIVVDQHCYGCTAGAGSSCGGQIATE
ncbi:MAG: radical SAM/Cys-rich domain protein [Candidatus Kapabacteria bacterium]|nr:radical SAM/Cys-rich domain protein [Candidatus Kapabacteria bacterium]